MPSNGIVDIINIQTGFPMLLNDVTLVRTVIYYLDISLEYTIGYISRVLESSFNLLLHSLFLDHFLDNIEKFKKI